MPKGAHGETCANAIQDSLRPGEIITFTTLFQRVKPRGTWQDATIWRHLMSCVVNLPPARLEWPSRTPFLFLHGDGRYELYDPAKHPNTQI
jgi:hypothetical protein